MFRPDLWIGIYEHLTSLLGAGFSGVYDVDSGKFLLYPIGETVLRSGLKPNNLVDRAGGRRAVDRALTDVLGNSSNNRIGFFVEVDSQGNLATRFTSGTINYANPNIRARIAPPEQGLKC